MGTVTDQFIALRGMFEKLKTVKSGIDSLAPESPHRAYPDRRRTQGLRHSAFSNKPHSSPIQGTSMSIEINN